MFFKVWEKIVRVSALIDKQCIQPYNILLSPSILFMILAAELKYAFELGDFDELV